MLELTICWTDWTEIWHWRPLRRRHQPKPRIQKVRSSGNFTTLKTLTLCTLKHYFVTVFLSLILPLRKSPHSSDLRQKLCSGWPPRHNHVCQDSKWNFQGSRFYRGSNFPFSYWFLNGPYNSAALLRCLWFIVCCVFCLHLKSEMVCTSCLYVCGIRFQLKSNVHQVCTIFHSGHVIMSFFGWKRTATVLISCMASCLKNIV